MHYRIRREHQYQNTQLTRSPRLLLVILLFLLLFFAACQKDSQPPMSAPSERVDQSPEMGADAVPASSAPASEPVPAAAETPLDLTLPPDLMRDTSPLPQEATHSGLPELFESEAQAPNQVSGKLLFGEGGQEGALDNVSGAQLEISVPIE